MVRLALWGMMGTGKTTVGRRLATFLELPFLDLDREIVRRTGRSIPAIFREEGEPAFRRVEKEVLLSILNRTEGGAMLSLGGGTLVAPENREALKRAGFSVVVLEAPPAVLRKRLAGRKDRPLLPRLEELLHTRQNLYARYPRVDASGSPVRTGALVLARLRLQEVQGIARDPHPVVLGDLEHPKGILLTHPHLHRLWAGLLSAEDVILYPPGERYKTLRGVERIATELIRRGADRRTPLVIAGGGVLGDLGGLVGALFARGMPVELVPTTLLAAVDAHIGGKTGVNFRGKNLLGVVRFPRKVHVDPRFFFTLPREYWLEGVVELLKALALTRRDFLDLAEEVVRDLRKPSYAGASRWVPLAVEAKLLFVREDPFEETGERFALNLGHTLGHALEAASGFRIRHGHAVAWGMVEEARLGVQLGVTDPGIPEVLEDLFTRLGVLPDTDREGVTSLVALDKKRTGGEVNLPLLRRWGEPVRVPVPVDTLRAFVSSRVEEAGTGSYDEARRGTHTGVHGS